MAATAIGKVETVGSFFVGQGDIVIFDKPANLASAKLSTLEGAKSLGNIHMDSTNYTGDDATIEEKKNEQGKTYYSTVVDGTESYEFFVPSTSSDMLQALLDAGVISDTFTAANPWAADSTVLGVSGSNVIEAPIALINDMKDQTMLYPNAKIVAKIGQEDKVMGIKVSVIAQEIKTTNLNTVMFIKGKAQYTA